MRCRIFAGVVAGLLLATPAFAARVPNGFIHVLLADRIATMAGLDLQAARQIFDNPNAYALMVEGNGRSQQAGRQLAAQGWHFLLAMSYFNFTSFRADVEAHTLMPGLAAVVYDNEKGATREGEIGDGGFDDPTSRRSATRRFYNLAKAQGLAVILAPGTLCNAGHVLGPRRFHPAGCYAYLRDISPYADIIDPQLQDLIRNPGVHLAVVRDSTSLIRSANPRIKVLAQFTTAAFRHYTPAENIAAMRAALPYVDGIWSNLASTPEGVQQGIDVLRAVR